MGRLVIVQRHDCWLSRQALKHIGDHWMAGNRLTTGLGSGHKPSGTAVRWMGGAPHKIKLSETQGFTKLRALDFFKSLSPIEASLKCGRSRHHYVGINMQLR